MTIIIVATRKPIMSMGAILMAMIITIFASMPITTITVVNPKMAMVLLVLIVLPTAILIDR